MKVKGVDLSYCQRGIDHNALKSAGVKFAVIRAGYSEAKDRLLETHVNGCLAAGIDIGYYWYSYARSVDDARREAEACLRAIAKYPAPKLPVFFDGEESGIADSVGRKIMTDIALEFISGIERGGYPSGLYVNPSWMETHYEKERFLTTDIWLAHWTGSPGKPSRYVYGQVMWQWGAEMIGGVLTDADICFIDYPARVADWFEERRKTSPTNSDDLLGRLAREVIAGKWGNGAERKRRLAAAGYDYAAVQGRVNELLCGR